MRREDVPPLLVQAADRLPEPDLADAAWAAGLKVRRRRRRIALVSGIVLLVALLIVSISIEVGSGGNADITPPNRLFNTPPGYLAPAGQIAGIDFWVAPPPGSERFLDRLETPLGDRLELPGKVHSLSKHKLDRIAAVVLVKNGGVYAPLLLGRDSSWSQAPVELVPVGGRSPLSPGAVSPDGKVVAFAQPGKLVTVDASTAEVSQYQLPAGDFQSVSWVEDAQYILVGGPGVAYRVLVGEGGDGEPPLAGIEASNDPEAVTAPFRIETGHVMRYLVTGEWTEDSTLTLPVRSWVGQTFSSGGGVARLFIGDKLPEVPTMRSQPQGVVAVSTLRTVPSRLLILGEPFAGSAQTPVGAGDPAFVRQPGCCAVLGWYDQQNVLVQVRGWVLAWDLDSGRVRRVTELAVDQVALGPGVRP
ncbi:hypothetical protein ACIA58_38640 [Kribbella sp. NPDC051586]|uniref:hypothetical protein n=1 Tax=Kribbella sp. NPDC051586 TaxID=3364118 RepID=UPI0037A6A072